MSIKLAIAADLSQEDLLAIKSCAFFTQCVLHLNPPRNLEPGVLIAFLDQADRVQELITGGPDVGV